MKSINNRFYLDHNATTPLSSSVKKWLESGVLFLANPSAPYLESRESQKIVEDCRELIFNTLKISAKDFDIVFHSGATEGINLFFTNFIEQYQNFIFAQTDHKIFHQIYKQNQNSKNIQFFQLLPTGEIDLDKKFQNAEIINITLPNNESGIGYDQEFLDKLKSLYPNSLIHVDGAQFFKRLDFKNYNFSFSEDWDCI